MSVCLPAGLPARIAWIQIMHIFSSRKKSKKSITKSKKTKAIQSHYWKTIEKALLNQKNQKKQNIYQMAQSQGAFFTLGCAAI
jgi:hypothetical protein